MALATLDDLAADGRTVLLRADFNVPLDDEGMIADDKRIRAALPTIEALRAAGSPVVVVAHLGRPGGQVTSELSLAPVARRLGELLGTPVSLAPGVTGDEVAAAVAGLAPGDVLMLENVRFDPRETSKDPAERAELASELAALAGAYVSDGFGVVHRQQASVTEVAELLPHAAGRLVAAEVDAFSKVLTDPDRPYTVVLGGSKVSDKLGVITHLIPIVDTLVIGGGMCFTFLAAQGMGVGASLCEEDQLDAVRQMLADAHERGVRVLLPTDIVVADRFAADAATQVVPADAIPDGWMGLDIGPQSAADFAGAIDDSATAVWNGPMGVSEWPAFESGTRAVAEAMSTMSARGGTSVIGGGDSAAAIVHLGLDPAAFSHISTGGGASLEYLEGRELPGLAVLEHS